MVRSKKRKHNEKTSTETEGNTEETNTEIEIKEEPVEAAQTEEKAEKQSEIKRRARIIVRNLPFKITEKKLKTHFEQYGSVVEVKILKKPDGRLVGCGFVQFEVVQNAAKAIYHATGKPLLDRAIVCDWALGKDTYMKNMKEAYEKEIKQEKLDEEESVTVKDEEDDTKAVVEADSTLTVEDSSEEESDSEEEEEEEEEEDDSENDEVEDVKDEEADGKRPRVISNDVQEGKTVFIKNLPFRATNEDVKECMLQFGPLYYALVCVDPLTEHSKGTAFVKFLNQADAEKCLEAGTELTLMGNVLDCHRAVNKNDLDGNTGKKQVKKDSRNLYLIKEGVILAGTKAAEGVSASDMAKRLELEKWKTQMLRNLNMFISWQRLIIHNLSPAHDDQMLRKLVARYAGPKAVIKEARVMRDMRNLDDKGVGKSKEFGFVAFAEHEDALRVLRALNNNPDVFSKSRRPIVAFSIENKAVINARNKRVAKSKLNNPTAKEYDPSAKRPEAGEEASKREGPKKRKWEKPRQSQDADTGKSGPNGKKQKWQKSTQQTAQEKPFAGVAAKPGGVNKMRSKFKLRTQAQLHHENLKKEKKRQKSTRKQDSIRQPGQKQARGKLNADDNFSKLVNKYKNNLTSNASAQKNKWYDT